VPRGTGFSRTPGPGSGAVSATSEEGKPRIARGWVSGVDSSERTIKLKGKNDEVTFMLDNRGTITEQNSAATFRDLNPGEHVMICYIGGDTDRVATEVRILSRA